MDKETESEVSRLDTRIDTALEDLADNEEKIKKLADDLTKLDKSVTKVWHIGVGVALGTIIDKFGLDKIITKLF